MRVIDLGLEIHKDMTIWPDPMYHAPELTFIIDPADDPLGRCSGQVKFHNHLGTHMDSPKHFGFPTSIDQADLNVLDGPAFIMKFPEVQTGPITAEMLDSKLPKDYDTKGKRLLIGTGYLDANWEKENYFEGAPYLHDSGARWAVEKGFVLVGLDCQTDGERDRGPVTHTELLSHGIYILEYICNVDQWPEGESFLVANPLKLRNMEASVVRPCLIEGIHVD